MNKILVLLFITAAGVAVSPGCSKKLDDTIIPPPVVIIDPVVEPPYVKDTTVLTLPNDWLRQPDLMESFPSGLAVYRNTTTHNGAPLNIYCLALDPKSNEVSFKPVLPTVATKPATRFTQESGKVLAVVNAGFFTSNTSLSLVVDEYAILAPNVKSLSRKLNGRDTTYYPTRGAFGIMGSGNPHIGWVYNQASSIYAYPNPSPNALGQNPQVVPTSLFPSGATLWDMKYAVGGSPVLLKGGEIRLTDGPELAELDNVIRRARTAIGYTASGKVLIVAAEGGNTNGAPGLTLLELAEVMKSMGCVSALNLDGGGSTSMVINNQLTVRPSSAGVERAVVAMIVIKKK